MICLQQTLTKSSESCSFFKRSTSCMSTGTPTALAAKREPLEGPLYGQWYKVKTISEKIKLNTNTRRSDREWNS